MDNTFLDKLFSSTNEKESDRTSIKNYDPEAKDKDYDYSILYSEMREVMEAIEKVKKKNAPARILEDIAKKEGLSDIHKIMRFLDDTGTDHFLVDKPCNNCGIGQWKPTVQKSILKCDECGALFKTFLPYPAQDMILRDRHRYMLIIGGYGAGKTITAYERAEWHILNVPNGRTLFGAATLPQLKMTMMLEFFQRFPMDMIEKVNKQDNEVTIKNGHKVIFRPLYDEGLIRSINLSCFHVTEASEIKYELFLQLKRRLRNRAAIIDGIDYRMGILDSNPEDNWVVREFARRSGQVWKYTGDGGRNIDTGLTEEARLNLKVIDFYATHIIPSYANPYLPDGWLEEQVADMSDIERERFIEGSLEYQDGLVYPHYRKNIIEPFEIPRSWPRLGGMDFGLVGTAYTQFAIDPEEGIIYQYKEYKQADTPIHKNAENVLTLKNDCFAEQFLFPIQSDPSGHRRNEGQVDFRSVAQQYTDNGLYTVAGDNRREDGIHKVYDYLYYGKLKIFSTCVKTIDEYSNYKRVDGKIEEVNNDHLMDAGRYALQVLPENPKDLVQFIKEHTQGRPQRSKVFNFPRNKTYDEGSIDYLYN